MMARLVPLLFIPMLAPACDPTRMRLTWEANEYLWVRSSETHEDSAVVMQGELLQTIVADGKRLYLVHSQCTDWRPDEWRCANSYISLSLVEGVVYDIVTWTEPSDRRSPSRERRNLQTEWTCCNEHPPDPS